MKGLRRILLFGFCGAALALVAAADQPTVDGYETVGFDRLASYTYVQVPAAGGDTAAKPAEAAQIPGPIRALNGRKVAVTGFMLPVKMDQGLVTEFLLVKDPMLCCYGIMPRINEWVVVRMTGQGVAPQMDVPTTFAGKLKVGELYANGFLSGLYLLEGEKQVATKKG